MKKDVSITIEGVQLGAEEEPVTVKVTGSYHYANGKHYIRYEEKTSEAEAGTSNTIKIAPAQVMLSKKGTQNSQMVFELNEITKTEYQTPYGTMLLDIRTDSILLDEEQDQLKLIMNYSLSAGASHISDNTITIHIKSII